MNSTMCLRPFDREEAEMTISRLTHELAVERARNDTSRSRLQGIRYALSRTRDERTAKVLRSTLDAVERIAIGGGPCV